MPGIFDKTIQFMMDTDTPDPRMNRYLMSHLELFSTLIMYLGSVYIGPKLMQKRQPFSLRNVIVVYNIAQIILNVYIFIEVVCLIDRLDLVCTPWGKELPDDDVILTVHYQFILLKYLDLTDTVLYILRKKQRQISFLHVYHHSSFLFYVWVMGKYTPGGQLILVVLYNTFVHCIMHYYYLYTSWHPRANLWWKKYVTVLQMVQNCLIVLSTLLSVMDKSCTYPKNSTAAYSVGVVFLTYLFGKFYKDTYLTKRD